MYHKYHSDTYVYTNIIYIYTNIIYIYIIYILIYISIHICMYMICQLFAGLLILYKLHQLSAIQLWPTRLRHSCRPSGLNLGVCLKNVERDGLSRSFSKMMIDIYIYDLWWSNCWIEQWENFHFDVSLGIPLLRCLRKEKLCWLSAKVLTTMQPHGVPRCRCQVFFLVTRFVFKKNRTWILIQLWMYSDS